jgi:hypothetical protein
LERGCGRRCGWRALKRPRSRQLVERESRLDLCELQSRQPSSLFRPKRAGCDAVPPLERTTDSADGSRRLRVAPESSPQPRRIFLLRACSCLTVPKADRRNGLPSQGRSRGWFNPLTSVQIAWMTDNVIVEQMANLHRRNIVGFSHHLLFDYAVRRLVWSRCCACN